MAKLLEIDNFRLAFHGEQGKVTAVRDVSLDVEPGETVALVGESGSGKTALCRAVLALHADHATVEAGRIVLNGREITALSEEALRSVRGTDAAMVFQDPMSSLNPVYSIGRQITDPMLAHSGGRMSRREAWQKGVGLLREMGIDHPEERMKQYPHHFSGGMRQRVAIAIALACEPGLLIADEPTTALDGDTQERIIGLLRKITKDKNLGMLFVTHDLGLAREIADRVCVMKAGRIVESGPAAEVFARPQHEYTKTLLRYARYGKAESHFHGKMREQFGSRRAEDLREGPDHPDSLLELAEHGRAQRPEERPETVLVEVRELSKAYELRRNEFRRVFEGVSLEIRKGEILGLIGPSGIGKSTFARILAGIEKPSGGSVRYLEPCKVQMIFQDSASAFDPRMTLRKIIAEPLVIAGRRDRSRKLSSGQLREKVFEVMDQVRLPRELADRRPYDVSGGERQRAAIARALITGPDLLIADEPVSSLDVSIQSGIVHLLKELHDQRGLTMLLISHDLPMVEHISDRIVQLRNETEFRG